MQEAPKETPKLEIDKDGTLKETGKREISVDSFKELSKVDYIPENNWIILQPLPEKETTTAGGIVIPGYVASKQEFKAAVVATTDGSIYKRGQVVRIDPTMWGPQGPRAEYICGIPLLECPEHFLKGRYPSFDLSGWSNEEQTT